jgi:hypothetical protein
MARKVRRRGEDDPRRRSPLGLANALGQVRDYALPVSKMSACEIAPAPTSPLTTMHREARLCRSQAITPPYPGLCSNLIYPTKKPPL